MQIVQELVFIYATATQQQKKIKTAEKRSAELVKLSSKLEYRALRDHVVVVVASCKQHV